MDQSTCTADGCGSPVSAKRLCKTHYNRDYYRRTLGAEIASAALARASRPAPTEKPCTKCKVVKPLEEFHVARRNQATGREPVCKSCRHEEYVGRRALAQARQRDYYWKNRERIRSYKARRWLEHRDVERSRNALSYQKNKASRSATAAARRADPEYAAEARRRTVEWRRANPERARVQDLLRHRRLRAAGRIPFTEVQLAARVAYFGGKCWMCGGPFEHLDHVKPVSLGGITALSNLRPACVSCNSLKRARWYGPQEIHRFIRT